MHSHAGAWERDTTHHALCIPTQERGNEIFSAIGHVVGLRFHDILLSKDVAFKRWTAGGLLIISSLGLIKIIT